MTHNIAKIRAALELQRGAMLMAESIGGPVKATKPIVESALAALAALETELSQLRAQLAEYEAAPTVAWLGVCDDGTKGAATCEKVRRLYERAGRHIYELIQRPQVTK